MVRKKQNNEREEGKGGGAGGLKRKNLTLIFAIDSWPMNWINSCCSSIDLIEVPGTS